MNKQKLLLDLWINQTKKKYRNKNLDHSRHFSEMIFFLLYNIIWNLFIFIQKQFIHFRIISVPTD